MRTFLTVEPPAALRHPFRGYAPGTNPVIRRSDRLHRGAKAHPVQHRSFLIGGRASELLTVAMTHVAMLGDSVFENASNLGRAAPQPSGSVVCPGAFCSP